MFICFLRPFGFLVALVAGIHMVAGGVACGGEAPRPNFLFILTDDQRWDALSVVQREQGDAARFPWLRTPNLDRLADEGARFRNAFVVSSLCCPSRASFLTGQYGHTNGVVNNHTPLAATAVTWATELRAAGYATGYVGKWHMGEQTDRPGFDYRASFLGQGRYENTPFIVGDQKITKPGWTDDISTDYAITFLQKHAKTPFALVIGYKTPHEPRTPAARAKSLYADDATRPVPSLLVKPPFRPDAGARVLNLENVRNYFRCITAIDDDVGRLLAALDELKVAETTVVVFCGDNGFYMGEHSLDDKRSAYEESLRIPLLVRYPRLIPPHTTVDAMVLNIDLAPTFLDLAKVPTPQAMQGKSWRPLLAGTETPWRQSFLYEYFFEADYPLEPPVLALRRNDAALITYPGHSAWTEVFDLVHDPFQLRNLASVNEATALRKQLENELDVQKKHTQFTIPPTADETR